MTTGLSFVTATQQSLDDPAKRLTIAVFARRLGQTREWGLAHPQEYNRIYAELTRLSPQASASITTRISHGIRPVSDEDVAKVQKVADLFSSLNILPQKVNVAAITNQSV